MRFLCITKNQGSGNTGLSQPGRHGGGAKTLERQRFSIIGRLEQGGISKQSKNPDGFSSSWF
jgi:hypothetical protein